MRARTRNRNTRPQPNSSTMAKARQWLLPLLVHVLIIFASTAAFSFILSRPPPHRLPRLHAIKPGAPRRRSTLPTHLPPSHDDTSSPSFRSYTTFPYSVSPLLLRLREATAPVTLSLLSLLGGSVGIASFSPSARASAATTSTSTTLLPSPLTVPPGSGQTYSQAMASTDPQHIKEINRRFARHVWATIGLSFYDKSGGGILGGRGGHDPAWERVWAAAEKRGEGGGGGGGGLGGRGR